MYWTILDSGYVLSPVRLQSITNTTYCQLESRTQTSLVQVSMVQMFISSKGASTTASSCLTNTTSVPTSGATMVKSPGMTSTVTSSSSRSPWSVPKEPPPTATSSTHTTHAARLLTIADTKVMTWWRHDMEPLTDPWRGESAGQRWFLLLKG